MCSLAGLAVAENNTININSKVVETNFDGTTKYCHRKPIQNAKIAEQAEEKIFVIEADAVGEMTGELTESTGGKLVLKDPANAKIGTYLGKVNCQ